jgi:hypothetical protein
VLLGNALRAAALERARALGAQDLELVVHPPMVRARGAPPPRPDGPDRSAGWRVRPGPCGRRSGRSARGGPSPSVPVIRSPGERYDRRMRVRGSPFVGMSADRLTTGQPRFVGITRAP